MTKSEFREKLSHYINLIHAVCAMIETFRYYRTRDELKAYEITKMVANLLSLDEVDFHAFDKYVQENWEGYYKDEELRELLELYGTLKAREVELIEIFRDDNLLETNTFKDE